MAAELVSVDDGLVTLRVSGRLTQSELASLQQRSAGIIRQTGTVRVLVLVEHFEGWEQGGQWDDFSFQEANDPHIARMAIVGDEKWRDLALLFTSKDLRQFPLEYFAADQLAAARAWLAA
ncbi:MAG: STAS/SEC14 domain-containing protein [Gammaproteobacteria bacterium]|nr:STAS/SEC14 domain-containing protein [Gammaproteobacteria bacterium]